MKPNTPALANGPIVFISRHESGRWLEALGDAMPRERLVDDVVVNAAELGDVEIAIVANPAPERLARYPNLRWVHSVWAGVERLVPLIAERNLPLVRLVDPTLAGTMAEAVLAWTFYIHRDMPSYAAQQRQRIWRPHSYVAARDLTVAVLGLGELGRAAAKRLVDAGYRVTGWSQSEKTIADVATYTGEAGLHKVLADANIVVVLLPLTPSTHHLLNAERIASMRMGASIINFARGAVVEADALLNALDDDALSRAVLDVFEEEPLPTTSPFWNHPKVTVLPHISAPTNPLSASRIVASNIAQFRRTGQVPATVDTKRGY